MSGPPRAALEDPPDSEEQRAEIREDIETCLAILQRRSDPRADEWVDAAVKKLVGGRQASSDGLASDEAKFAEIVRRGLLEIERRRLSRLRCTPAMTARRRCGGSCEASQREG